MAILQVKPNAVHAPQSGELDERSQRRYIVTWLVQTDSNLDGPQVVGDAPGLPKLFSTYVFGNDVDNGSRLKRISPRRMADEPRWWEVELEYDSFLHAEPFGNRDPMARPPRVRWATVPYQKTATHDNKGRAIQVRSGEEIDPPHMKDASRVSLSITRNELNFQVALAFSYVGDDGGAVASDSFFGFAPFEPKMMSVESDLITEGEYSFWQTTYQIHFLKSIFSGPTTPNFVDPDGIQIPPGGLVKPWNLTYPNVGFYRTLPQGVDGISAVVPCIDDKNGKSVVPFKLGKNGEQISQKTPRTQQYYVTTEIYPEKPFAPLNLP